MASTQPVLLHSLLFGHGTTLFLDSTLASTAAGGVCSPFELASTHYYYALELEHWRSQEEAAKKTEQRRKAVSSIHNHRCYKWTGTGSVLHSKRPRDTTDG